MHLPSTSTYFGQILVKVDCLVGSLALSVGKLFCKPSVEMYRPEPGTHLFHHFIFPQIPAGHFLSLAFFYQKYYSLGHKSTQQK
jgi:hypothetical protein